MPPISIPNTHIISFVVDKNVKLNFHKAYGNDEKQYPVRFGGFIYLSVKEKGAYQSDGAFPFCFDGLYHVVLIMASP